jgi:3-oxoacyl-(acyl-carrier-protein) synthase
MQEIHIILWRHEEEDNWSVQIDGKFHKHISAKTIDELTEYAVVAAEQALLELEAPIDRSAVLCFGIIGG